MEQTAKEVKLDFTMLLRNGLSIFSQALGMVVVITGAVLDKRGVELPKLAGDELGSQSSRDRTQVWDVLDNFGCPMLLEGQGLSDG